ncbi:hypothetical protein [Novacetimonas maltaceti]|uniref:Uncharacterized protein n=1 Tax=Novacetimonas maltaceti TaxID=1203393 RepID=A0A2S3VZX1_9PROT|nr:hypothetical protein [Novacetimonas maltaceti]POF62152.1 hypothetical protein KMAL_21660 [Novacetimonas maltaceti]BCZ75976.1 hypothetical protein [Komagataeibacter phage phiKM1]
MTTPAIRMNVSLSADALVFDKKALARVFRQAGNEVAATARTLLRQSSGGGRLYYGPGGSAGPYRGGYRAGKYRASAPGQIPAKITGTLARSIRVRPFRSGEGVAIRDTAFYALFLEAGAHGGGRSSSGGAGGRATKGTQINGRTYRRGNQAVGKSRVLTARPFLEIALTQREASLGPRIRRAVQQGIKMEKAPSSAPK